MVAISKSASSKIANVSFVCACLVVLIHCPKAPGDVMIMHNYLPGAFTSVVNAFFFAAAGFFLAAHVEENGWWKRVHSLLIPYLVLNALWFGVQVVYQWPNVRYPADSPDFHWIDVLKAFGIGSENPVNGPLWFVRSLLLFVLTLPLFVPLIRYRRLAHLLCLALLGLNCIDFWGNWLPGTLYWIYRPQWLAFFLGGVALRIHGVHAISRRMGWICLVAGFVMSCYAHANKDDGEIIPLYNVVRWLSRPFLIVGLISVMPAVKWPKFLIGNSFAIYALHWPLIVMAHIICGRAGIFDVVFGNIFYSALYVICVVGLTIVVAEMLRRSKVLNRYVLGGR